MTDLVVQTCSCGAAIEDRTLTGLHSTRFTEAHAVCREKREEADRLAARVAELEAALRDKTEALTMLRDAWNAHFAVCASPSVQLPSFEEIERWRNAPSNTASAVLADTAKEEK